LIRFENPSCHKRPFEAEDPRSTVTHEQLLEFGGINRLKLMSCPLAQEGLGGVEPN